MPTPKKGPRLGGSAKHQNMMVANLATELFRHGRITTTKSRAKTMQPVAERMITFAKRGDLHARRQVLTVIRDKDVVHKLFADIGPAAAGRSGGYTRLVNIENRKGDNAPMAVIELVDITEAVDTSGPDLTEAPRRRWSLRRSRPNISRAAREREEEIMAAEDAGDVEALYGEDEDEGIDAVPIGSLDKRELGSPSSGPASSGPASSGGANSDDQAPAAGGARDEDEDGPEVRPEDVEARLAMAEADDEAAAADAADPADEDAAADEAAPEDDEDKK